MIIKILAVLGIVFIFFCVSVAFAVIMASYTDYEDDPEEDAEQAAYLKEWRKKRGEKR